MNRKMGLVLCKVSHYAERLTLLPLRILFRDQENWKKGTEVQQKGKISALNIVLSTPLLFTFPFVWMLFAVGGLFLVLFIGPVWLWEKLVGTNVYCPVQNPDKYSGGEEVDESEDQYNG